MRAIKDMGTIQIEVTNSCMLECCHCTRFCGHHTDIFFAKLGDIANAIDSLDGFGGIIGLMGGEPMLHPQFTEICRLFRQKIPNRRQRGLWTAGIYWDKYREDIKATFDEDKIVYNDHSNPTTGKHQPLLVAIDEVMHDKALMWKMIDNCWINKRWSASITPKGAFFCEVAAAQDWLFDGPGGWPVEPGWWKKEVAECREQMERYCINCSACLPITESDNHYYKDTISDRNAERLKACGSARFKRNQYVIADVGEIEFTLMNRGFTGMPGPEPGSFAEIPEWTPWNFRPEIYYGPGEGKLTYEETRKMQRGLLSYEEAVKIVDERANTGTETRPESE